MSWVIFKLTPVLSLALSLFCFWPFSCWTPVLILLTQLNDPAFLSSHFSFLSPSSLFCPFLFLFCTFLTQRRSIRLPTCLQKRLVSLLHLLSPLPISICSLVSLFCISFFSFFFAVWFLNFLFPTITVLFMAIWLLKLYFCWWLTDCVGLVISYFYNLSHARIVGSLGTMKCVAST